MYSYTTICWLFSRVYVLVVGLNVLATTYPTFFYPWKGSNRRYQIRFPELPRNFNPPTRISYKLDAWSQYDNPEEGRAREGDIKERPGSRKTMTTNKFLLWPNGVVPYCIEDSLVNEPEKLAIVEGAMAKIMELTCLKFVRIYPQPDGQYPFFAWVNITGKDEGCYSDLGRSARSPSILNLDVDRCFRTNGHALHEILHTLGAFHEHMRPDRDEYIQVLWNNIREGDEFNFRIVDENTATTYGLPYDYDSIMHYSMTAFSKDRSIPTIVPRKQGVQIGQREYLSFYDIQKLLITYKCNEVDSKYVHRDSNEERGDYVEWVHSNTTETVRRASHAILEMPRNNVYDHKRIYTWQPWTVFYHLKYPSYRYPDDDYYH